VPDPSPVTLGVGEALDLLGSGLAVDDVGPLLGIPLLAVDLGAPGDLHTLATLTRDLPCVVVGIDTGSNDATTVVRRNDAQEGFDVLLTPTDAPRPWVEVPEPQGALSSLSRAVDSSPLAALCLVQLLRCTEAMSIPDALAAESWIYSMLQAGPAFARWLSGRPRKTDPIERASPVLVERSGSRLHVRLNRPHVRNALSAAMRDALIDALRTVVADPTITEVVLSGNGPSFCSGGDLAEFGSAPDPATAHAVRVTRSAGAWLARCAERVTAEVHGACIGAGIELPAFAGRIRAAPDARFSLPEVAMGLIPGAGGTASITRRVGRQRAVYLALSGAQLPVETAHRWGLVDEIGEIGEIGEIPGG
jgi:enoyl-CoA hydratase/carnithine racemase